MPTYEYSCQACGHCFEQFQSITARALRKCPQCGKLKLNRLIGSGAGILFKGNGFYETDYRSESYKQAQKKESSDSGDGTAPGKKTETTEAKGGKAESTASKKGPGSGGDSKSTSA